jgi:hypothetical protein
MKNKIEDLRNHLFAQLERLDDPDCSLEDEIQKAKAIVDISEVIIDSARAENEFLKIADTLQDSNLTSGFILPPTKC